MRRLATALSVMMLLAPGCAGPGTSKDPSPGAAPVVATPAPARDVVADQVLTLEELRNASYPLSEANGILIKFTNGKYRGPVLQGSLEELRFAMPEPDRIARGDMDGDGVEDAALLIVKDPAGEKPSYTLWVVINLGGVPDPRGQVLLGENVQVGGMSIEGLKVYVDVVRPGLEDVQGMPVRRIKESYKLIGTRLERADLFR